MPINLADVPADGRIPGQPSHAQRPRISDVARTTQLADIDVVRSVTAEGIGAARCTIVHAKNDQRLDAIAAECLLR